MVVSYEAERQSDGPDRLDEGDYFTVVEAGNYSYSYTVQPSLLMSRMADCVVAQIDPCRLSGVTTTERF